MITKNDDQKKGAESNVHVLTSSDMAIPTPPGAKRRSPAHMAAVSGADGP